MRKIAAFFTAALAGLASATAAIAGPPPVTAYAALPAGADVHLSPDGSAIAMIGASAGQQAFVVSRFDGTPPKVFSMNGWIAERLLWKSPTRLLAVVRTSWSPPGRDDIEVANRRLLVIDAQTGAVRAINFGGSVISLLPADPDHILLSNGGVWQIDLASGGRSLMLESRSNVVQWLADAAGHIRGDVTLKKPSAFDHDQRAWLRYAARADKDDSWHELEATPLNGTAGPDFVAFDPADADRVLLSTDGPRGFRIIQAYSIRSGHPTAIVAQDPDADVTPLISGERLVGYEAEGTSETYHYLDPAWDHDARAMSHAIGGGTLQIISRVDDGRHVLGLQHEGSQPDLYWLLDRAGPKTTLKAVLNAYEQVRPGQVAEGSWVSYPARDGMTISAILTMPLNRKPGPVPFIVMPHGGPHARDRMGFDWIAQFLVSRGFGVLQPQFRASTGFGKAIFDGGFHQWGRAVQDDIADGARAMIARHLADPARIAIVGASFGGYSALEEMEREPGLFRAAAAWAPVTDLPLLEGGGMRRFARKDLQVTEAGASYEEIEEASPIHGIGRMSAPILIVHGRKDFTVPVRQTELLVRALKDAGKPVQAIYLPDADHFMSDAADRLAWLQALETFLAANLHTTTPG